jgi:hypothetical protein
MPSITGGCFFWNFLARESSFYGLPVVAEALTPAIRLEPRAIMAIENLPRPWLLAALTGLRVAELLGPDDSAPTERPPRRPLPRPESRRRRASDAGDRGRHFEPAEGWFN